MHVSGGFKRLSRWSCVEKEPDGSTYPTLSCPSASLLHPRVCLGVRVDLDMKMDFPSLFTLSLSLFVSIYSFYTRYNFLRERTNRFSLLRRALITYLDAAREKLRRSTYVPKSLCGAPVKKTIQLCRSIVNAARRGSFLDDV